MNAHTIHDKWNQLPEDVRRRWDKFTDEDWKAIRSEAIRLIDDLQEKSSHMVEEARQKIDRRYIHRQKPIERFIRHNPWLPVVAGLGLVTALVVVNKSK